MGSRLDGNSKLLQIGRELKAEDWTGFVQTSVDGLTMIHDDCEQTDGHEQTRSTHRNQS